MSIKPFMDLYGLDISGRISKKPTFRFNKRTGKFEETGEYIDYLNWADVLLLLHENGAERVSYGNMFSPSGHSLFLTLDNLPEVHVYVDIDGERHEMSYPVIDGSSVVKMEKITQSDVHNASQRAFVKCVAINWGLGLSLWQKEEKLPLAPPELADAESVFDRLMRKANKAAERYGGAEQAAETIGMSAAGIKKLLKSAREIAILEAALDEALK